MKLVVKDRKHLPVKGSVGAMCYDLKASFQVAIKPGEIKLVGTGIKTNFANKIYIRSSGPIKYKRRLANGVGIIDADFYGEIMAMIENIGHEVIFISEGDRIVQIEMPEGVEMEENIDKFNTWHIINTSERGEGGFGSTDEKVFIKNN